MSGNGLCAKQQCPPAYPCPHPHPCSRSCPRRASGRRMCRAVRDFLFAQTVQAPLEVYSEWLSVGHVDEFLTFVPALDRKVPTLEPPQGSSQHPKNPLCASRGSGGWSPFGVAQRGWIWDLRGHPVSPGLDLGSPWASLVPRAGFGMAVVPPSRTLGCFIPPTARGDLRALSCRDSGCSWPVPTPATNSSRRSSSRAMGRPHSSLVRGG